MRHYQCVLIAAIVLAFLECGQQLVCGGPSATVAMRLDSVAPCVKNSATQK
ncbi:MAG: hypothetical protein SFX18_08935 [Pirellulales bacterium]|nr:hypothetical protein [Pirellulales bacterium]